MSWRLAVRHDKRLNQVCFDEIEQELLVDLIAPIRYHCKIRVHTVWYKSGCWTMK